MLKRFLVAILIVSMLTGFGLVIQPQVAQAAVTLSVDTGTVIQDNFLGIGAVYHGFAYMPESVAKGYNDTLRDIEFNRVDNMDLPIARTWYRADWACGTSGYPSYDWNSTKMTAFYNWLAAMKSRNVDVAINAGWWFTNDVYNGDADTSTWATKVTQYAAWMSESLNQIINVRGYTNVKYVLLFTEPTSYESGPLPSGYTQYQAYKEVVTALNNKLVADGRRSLVKLVGPNNCNWDSLSTIKDDLNDVIDIYSTHSYSMAGYDGWYTGAANIKTQIASTGKPFWIDEYGKQDEAYRDSADYGNYIAQATAAFINAGTQSSQIWLLFDQQYPSPLDTLTNGDSFVNGVHKWGTAQFLPTSQIPRPSYYAFSMMSKYMGRDGTEVYSTTNADGVYISAVKLPSGDWSFLVVNGNYTTQDITVNMTGAINKTLYRHLYDPNAIIPDVNATILGYDRTFSNVGTSFTDVIPSRGVAIYTSVISGIGSTPMPTPTPAPAPVKAWEFTSDTEGWTVLNQVSGFGWASGGYVNGAITGTDPYIHSGSSLGVAITDYKHVKVRMKNSTTGTIGKIYFITNLDAAWNEAKSKTFSIIANDSGYTEYDVDMSTVPGWTGTLNQLRLDPVDLGVSSGSFSVDYIRITLDTAIRTWEFTSDTEGWTVLNQVSGLGWVSGGYVNGVITGTDPCIRSGSSLGVPITDYKRVKVCMKNSTTGTIGKIYFITNLDTTWNEAKSITFSIIANDSGYTEYDVDMSTLPEWTGTLNQLRLDPVESGASSGSFSVDYIRITPTTVIKAWEFTSDTEGWTVLDQITQFGWVNGGFVNGILTGTDPCIRSGSSLGVPITDYKHVKVCMKNNTFGTTAKVYFITNTDTMWNEAKSKTFSITAKDSSYTEYDVDMSTISDWTGTLNQLRLDPVDSGANNNYFSIDYVRIVQ